MGVGDRGSGNQSGLITVFTLEVWIGGRGRVNTSCPELTGEEAREGEGRLEDEGGGGDCWTTTC